MTLRRSNPAKKKPARTKSRPQAKRTTLRRKADALFSLYVRRGGRCEAAGYKQMRCSSQLQCAHIVSRRYLAVRYTPLNAIAMCAGHHKFFTEHPLEWDVFVENLLGLEPYKELRRLALKGGLPDYAAVISELHEKMREAA